jgi:hypothetical protein
MTDGPLTQLRYVATLLASLPSPTRGEGTRLRESLLHGLLAMASRSGARQPLVGEKVPEGRMRDLSVCTEAGL